MEDTRMVIEPSATCPTCKGWGEIPLPGAVIACDCVITQAIQQGLGDWQIVPSDDVIAVFDADSRFYGGR